MALPLIVIQKPIRICDTKEEPCEAEHPDQFHIVAELIRVLRLDLLPLIVIQKPIRICDTKEEPCEALEIFCVWCFLCKDAAQEGAHWCNTCASRHHDDI